jgi:hypothetical protein
VRQAGRDVAEGPRGVLSMQCAQRKPWRSHLAEMAFTKLTGKDASVAKIIVRDSLPDDPIFNEGPMSYDVFSRFTERWPKAGDRLFVCGRDSFLAERADERRYRLLEGYKRAGDILIQIALADPYDRNALVWPAIFNYRHYIELALKAIIEEHGPFAGESLGQKDHKLPELWQLFVKVAAAFGYDCSDATTAAVGRCIGEFADVDDRSTAFRYACNKDGSTPTLPSGLDLVRLHDVINGIENFFECVDLHFTHEAEQAAEAWLANR